MVETMSTRAGHSFGEIQYFRFVTASHSINKTVHLNLEIMHKLTFCVTYLSIAFILPFPAMLFFFFCTSAGCTNTGALLFILLNFVIFRQYLGGRCPCCFIIHTFTSYCTKQSQTLSLFLPFFFSSVFFWNKQLFSFFFFSMGDHFQTLFFFLSFFLFF